MIVSEYVEMPLINRTYKKLIKKYNLSKDLKVGDVAKIPLTILSKSSHYEIDITCDYCNKPLRVPYKRYNLYTKVINKYACTSIECSNQKIKDVCQVKFGVDNPFQSKEIKTKIKESLIEKYGVEHPMFLQGTIEKIKETCLERYGVSSFTKTGDFLRKSKEKNIEKWGVEHHAKTKEGQEKRKNTRIKRGNQIPDNLVSDFRKYRLIVNRSLQKSKKIILENWNGLDYYDGELIKDNFNLEPSDRLYPHFDHKISVSYGFKNNIDPEKISSLDNICITKNWINCLKKEMNSEDFLQIFQEIKKSS